MKNSEWFWLAVCVTCFALGVSAWGVLYFFDTTEGQELALIVGGLLLVLYAFGYFIFELHTPFNKWLDNL